MVDHSHKPPAPRRLDRTHQPGRTGADNQHVNSSRGESARAHRARIVNIGCAGKGGSFLSAWLAYRDRCWLISSGTLAAATGLNNEI
jgi:hypothetical protein